MELTISIHLDYPSGNVSDADVSPLSILAGTFFATSLVSQGQLKENLRASYEQLKVFLEEHASEDISSEEFSNLEKGAHSAFYTQRDALLEKGEELIKWSGDLLNNEITSLDN